MTAAPKPFVIDPSNEAHRKLLAKLRSAEHARFAAGEEGAEEVVTAAEISACARIAEKNQAADVAAVESHAEKLARHAKERREFEAEAAAERAGAARDVANPAEFDPELPYAEARAAAEEAALAVSEGIAEDRLAMQQRHSAELRGEV